MTLCAWGANSHGQLGLGHASEFELPTVVPQTPENIKLISAGGGHTAILNDSGELFVCGWNNKGQLGIGSTQDCLSFTKLVCNEKFTSVECGWDTTFALSQDNKLFVWGSNQNSQLGFSSEHRKTFTTPTLLVLPNHDTAKLIQCGLRHTAILTQTNQIYIVGSLKHFKHSSKGLKHEIINHNDTEYLRIITSCEMHPNGKIHHMSAGQNHISLVVDGNLIRGIGDDKFSQCSEIKLDRRIMQIMSGWTHNGFLTENRELFLYGRNCYGQLGIGIRSDSCSTPQILSLPTPVEHFQLGSEHGIALSGKAVYAWGWNEHGNCGNGDINDVLKPQMVVLPVKAEPRAVFAGSGFCMVLCKAD